MKVVGKRILADFAKQNPNVCSQVASWLAEAEEAAWLTPIDVKERFAHASILGGRRIVFNLKGNSFRLLVKVSYKNQIISIRKIGTHKDYEKWDLEK